MWQLSATNHSGEWQTVDEYSSLAAAARKIIEIEGYPVSGVFFDVLVETNPLVVDDSLSYFEHTGRNSKRLYVAKQMRH